MDVENTLLVIIDFQEKLARAMYEKDALVNNVAKMIKGAKALGLTILMTEQNPDGLGRTIPEVAELLPDVQPISKLSFSCCGEPRFAEELARIDPEMVLVAGIESHVCVYQTVADLLEMGYDVEVITDAVSSRTLANKIVGLEKCQACGAWPTSVETALFELLQVAEGEPFKEIIKIVR